MRERVPSCPTCNVKMELGFTPDKGHGDRQHISTWVAGEPVKSLCAASRWKHRCRSLHIAARIAGIWHRSRARLCRE
jgi:hypothetical protein